MRLRCSDRQVVGNATGGSTFPYVPQPPVLYRMSLGGLHVRFGEGDHEGYDLLGFLHTYCIIHGRKPLEREVDSCEMIYTRSTRRETGDG